MRFLEQKSAKRRVHSLDEKDKKLLTLIAQNVRLPISKLAKNTAISRDSVSYRWKRFEQNEIIQGYRTIINADRLNLLNFHIFLQLRHADTKLLEELRNFFMNHANTRAVIRFSGNWDFEVAFIARTIQEADSILTEIKNSFASNIHNSSVLFLTKTYVAKMLPRSFNENLNPKLGKNDSSFHSDFKKIKQKENIDEIDTKILENIAENPKQPLLNIARTTKASNDTVTYKIRNLIQAKYILGFIPVINYSMLDYHVYAVFLRLHAFTAEKERMFKEFLATHPDVLWATKTIGRWDALLYLCVRNQSEFHLAMEQIRSTFYENIKSYETSIAFEEYKYTFFPELYKKLPSFRRANI